MVRNKRVPTNVDLSMNFDPTSLVNYVTDRIKHNRRPEIDLFGVPIFATAQV